MLLNKSLLSLIIFGVAVHGENFLFDEIQLNGSCPKISYITNLDIPRILGWYYRAYSNLDNPLCFNNEGQTMYAAQYDETRINVEICCRSAAQPTIAICGANVGSGVVAATQNPGEFTYQFEENIYPDYILDTDYDNFTIVYGCKPGSRNLRDEVIFVLSRDYTLNPTLQARVRAVLERNGVQWSKVKPVKQGRSTPYTPFAKQCT